jgi:hypothetical protein
MHKGLFSRFENLRRDFYAYKRHHELPPELRSTPANDRLVAEGKVIPADAVRSAERDLQAIISARYRLESR